MLSPEGESAIVRNIAVSKEKFERTKPHVGASAPFLLPAI
ncbi:hypothetical protein SeGA_4657 [Salmonella enterica subsp. enterica serovar Gaminara str. A4-567]|nr:hypothetical protein SeGA_4657 [Salmonella enterica subsp. enterica serovar Gaminara str. A4-567]